MVRTMKYNFFGINVTKGSSTGEIAGAAFAVRSVPKEQNQAMEELESEYETLEQKSSLPAPLGLVKFLCGLVWLILFCAIIQSDDFAEVYHRVPAFYWICGICFAVWMLLLLWEKRRRKRTAKSAESAACAERGESLLQNVQETLGIPADAVSIDVLAEQYTVKKDGALHHKSIGLAEYFNADLRAFAADGNLYLADITTVWEIPLTALRSVTREKKRYNFPNWNKEEAYNAAKYKPFQITTNQFGHYFARCYRAEIADTRGEFYLLIPEYDWEAFTALTHLHQEA